MFFLLLLLLLLLLYVAGAVAEAELDDRREPLMIAAVAVINRLLVYYHHHSNKVRALKPACIDWTSIHIAIRFRCYQLTTTTTTIISTAVFKCSLALAGYLLFGRTGLRIRHATSRSQGTIDEGTGRTYYLK